MKNLGKITVLLACLLIGNAAGAVRNPAGLIPVNINIKTHDQVYWLAKQGINIEELRGKTAEARITQAQMDMLTASGYLVELRTEEAITDAQLTGYHNYTQMTAFLDSIHAAYPAITKKVSFGTTVQGRSLWAFLITDNPDSEENEAEVRLAANIHGDEVVGKELLLALIDSLTKTYATSATIANLVNNRAIWIVPSLNPDGNMLSQRYNANGEDLNRDYPVPDGGSNGGSVSGTETETQQTISYWGAKHTSLSMVFHGGAVVANYPWDYTTTICPDDALARTVSLGYSKLNTPMYNSTEFTNGITNGGAWYIVRGSLQDWSYNSTGGLEITVECSNDKWPAASTLPGFWNDNKNSLLYFIRKAGEGVGGVVSDSTTGLPLSGVAITVTGTGKAVTSDVPGDYHRMLPSGTYSLSFAKTGYTTKSVSGVRVNFDSLTTLNVTLKPTGTPTPTLAVSSTSWAPAATASTSSAISVTNSGSTSVIAYTVASSQTWLTVSSASGSTPGSFTMTAAANTGAARSATVTVTATTSGVAGSPKTITVSQAAGGSGTQNDAGTGADAGNTFALATAVSSGSWTGCYLDATDRNDYYAFTATSGQSVKVKITPPSSADYDLYLYNPSQTQVASSTRGAGLADSVVYTATVTGIFYAKAYEYSGTGNYSLLISLGGGTTTPTLAVSSTSWAPAATASTSSAISVTNSGSTSVIAYTVASSQTWLTVSSASGSTPGSFTMTAAANTGAARSATVTVTATTSGVAGSPKTITVSQAAGGSGTWTNVSATNQSAHPYTNSYNYTWTITGPVGATKMKVYFDSIKTETKYDSVYILNSAGTVIQSYTGTFRAVWSNEVAGNVVKIRLKTDGSVTGFGFQSNQYSYYTAAAIREEMLASSLSPNWTREFTELLCQNRPNPVAKGTEISFNLPSQASVSLKIYNLNGQTVKTVVSGTQAAGHHTIEWDGRDYTGHSVATGTYIYRLTTDDLNAVKRMIVIR
jgi:hypothetical protein